MSNLMNLFTIGFTEKSAERFFSLLKTNGVRQIIDTRLNNTGQLAGFSKRDDLAYFSRSLLGVEYFHWLESAPEDIMLSAYKKKQIGWDEYTKEYLSLLQRRRVETQALKLVRDNSCLLCSEAKPHMCHRRLLADYLTDKLGVPLAVKHLI